MGRCTTLPGRMSKVQPQTHVGLPAFIEESRFWGQVVSIFSKNSQLCPAVKGSRLRRLRQVCSVLQRQSSIWKRSLTQSALCLGRLHPPAVSSARHLPQLGASQRACPRPPEAAVSGRLL